MQANCFAPFSTEVRAQLQPVRQSELSFAPCFAPLLVDGAFFAGTFVKSRMMGMKHEVQPQIPTMNRRLPHPASPTSTTNPDPLIKYAFENSNSLIDTKQQEHPAIVHGSDLIVWGAPENCVRCGDGDGTD